MNRHVSDRFSFYFSEQCEQGVDPEVRTLGARFRTHFKDFDPAFQFRAISVHAGRRIFVSAR